MRPAHRGTDCRSSRRAVGWAQAILMAALLLVPSVLVACASSEGPTPTTSSSAAGSSVVGAATDSVLARQVGAPGPDGIGAVVATSDGSGTYIDVTPDELATMLKNKDFLLINTHVPYEGEIEQTDLFLPYDQAAQQVDKLPADKNAKIVVYCRSDRMSRIAIEEWVKAGYANLYNLDGGFEAWEQAGHELLRK